MRKKKSNTGWSTSWWVELKQRKKLKEDGGIMKRWSI